MLVIETNVKISFTKIVVFVFILRQSRIGFQKVANISKLCM